MDLSGFPANVVDERSLPIIREWRACGFSDPAILKGTTWFSLKVRHIPNKTTRQQIWYNVRADFQKQFYPRLLTGELRLSFSDFCREMGLTPEAAEEYMQIAEQFPVEPLTLYPIFTHILETRLDQYDTQKWKDRLTDGYEQGLRDREPVYAWPPILEFIGSTGPTGPTGPTEEKKWTLTAGRGQGREIWDFLYPEDPVGFRICIELVGNLKNRMNQRKEWMSELEWTTLTIVHPQGFARKVCVLKSPPTPDILRHLLLSRYPGDLFYWEEPTVQKIISTMETGTDSEIEALLAQERQYPRVATAEQIWQGRETSHRVAQQVQTLECSPREKIVKFFLSCQRFRDYHRRRD